MSADPTSRTRAVFRRVAPGWDRWGDKLQRDDAVRYLEAARVAPGDRVLEVGAGSGEQTLHLAAAVGPAGSIVATDLSPDMLAIAARRCHEAGLANVEFVVAALDDLDFPHGSFAACVSGFTWMFLPDPVAAAARVRRLLTPGGYFAASVWGPVANMAMATVAGAAVFSALGLAPPQPAPPEVDLEDPATFHRLLVDAGFDEVAVEELPMRLRWESAADYAATVRAIVPMLSDLIDEHAPDRVDEIWASVTAAAATRAAPDGTVTLDNQAFLGSGRRPG